MGVCRSVHAARDDHYNTSTNSPIKFHSCLKTKAHETQATPCVAALAKIDEDARYSAASISQDYDVQRNRVLGEGASGAVFKAVHRRTGENCAVKVLGHSKGATNEVNVSLRVSHPNIARVFNVYENADGLTMVMEMGEGGDLFERLAEEGPFTEAKAARVLHQILLAVEYLHEQGYVHTDLKLENILFQSTSSDAEVLVIDFGFAQTFNGQKLSDRRGTLGYMAPEVLKGSYTNKCDIFSLGVIAFGLLSGKSAFGMSEPMRTNRRILTGDYSFKQFPAATSPGAMAFVAKLLTVDPEKRPSATEALEDPWLVSHCGGRSIIATTLQLRKRMYSGVSEASTCVPPSERRMSETTTVSL
jgi:calcium-dependent protein kinase